MTKDRGHRSYSPQDAHTEAALRADDAVSSTIEDDDNPPPGWKPLSKGGRNYVPTGRPSGRPPLPEGQRMISQILSLPPAQVNWLKAHPKGMSAAARNAIAKAMSFEQKAPAPTDSDVNADYDPPVVSKGDFD